MSEPMENGRRFLMRMYTDEERAELGKYGFDESDLDRIEAFADEQERHRGEVASKVYKCIREGKGAWNADPDDIKRIREGGRL